MIEFIIISSFILVFALLSVTTRKIFRSAIYLLFTLMGVAALYFALHYEFLGAVQIVVYVGGIVVLILFSLFLTQQAGIHLRVPAWHQLVLIVLAVGFGGGFVYSILQHKTFLATTLPPVEVSVSNIGHQLLDMNRFGYLLPFEVVSILLLAAMIGAIVIAFKSGKND